ncbi:MAG: LuxR C-terminal-related transcriptional regulator [Acidimicrobiia bacterium]
MTRSRTGPDATSPTTPPLVLAKTNTPIQRAGLVRRTSLIERLTEPRDRSVTLVHAPAGYGKSTLLMEWVTSDPMRRFGWLTLEQTENDPALLWRYTVLTLRALTPGFADRAWGLLRVPQPDIDEVVTHVLNALLGVTGRLVLVLDDYHVITNPECHESMQFFLDRMPSTMHVAFGTRSRPPLSLSRLEASASVLSINAAALRFSASETEKALDNAGVRLKPDDVIRVHERTEGWPAGVYLSSIAPRNGHGGTAASGGSDGVRSYLMEQVVEQLEPEDRLALRTWSMLRHLGGDLCDCVSNRRDSASRLERWAKTNLLLMPLDADGDWYRLHDLLKDALLREFAMLPLEDRRLAHVRAMDWWLEDGDTAQAIHHGLEAGEFERVAELFSMHWLHYLLDGWGETLRDWIDRIPVEELLAYPPILVASAWVVAFSGDVRATHRFATAARDASHDGPMPDGSASYRAAVATLEAGLGLNGMTDANEHAELANQLEPPGGPGRPLAAALAGLTRFGLGRVDDAREALSEAASTPTGEDGVAVYALGQLALLEMAQENWEIGAQHALRACELIDEFDLHTLVPSGAAQVARAVAAAHDGNNGSARQYLRSLAGVQGQLSNAIPFDAFQIHLIMAETYLAIGDDRAARIHARTATIHLEAFGDGGIFDGRLADLLEVLAAHQPAESAADSEIDPLTDRELDVLVLLASDLSLRDIGNELFVSRNTAKSHVASIYRKLDVTTRTAAVAKAQDQSLI